jgi:hypothetical protein
VFKEASSASTATTPLQLPFPLAITLFFSKGLSKGFVHVKRKVAYALLMK